MAADDEQELRWSDVGSVDGMSIDDGHAMLPVRRRPLPGGQDTDTGRRGSGFSTREVDTDRLGGGRASWRAAALATVSGLVLGAVIGYAVQTTQPASVQAETAVSVLPDAVALGNQSSGDPSLDPVAFIQGQLVTINGAAVTGKVRSSLGLGAAPSVTATQVGQTYVVSIDATASSDTKARAVAATTAKVYRDLRVSNLTGAIKQQLASTDSRLAKVQDELARQQRRDRPNAAATPSETALQTESERLLAQASSLTVELPQVGGVVTVQAPAHTLDSGSSAGLIAAVIGAIAGAVLALLVLLLYRRWSPRVRGIGDLVGMGVPVLLPVVPRGRRGGSLAAGVGGPVRLLAARLTNERRRRVLVVVGAGRGVGTSRTSSAVAVALGSRGPVLLVLANHTAQSADVVGDAETPGRIVATDVAHVHLLPNGADLIGAGDADYAGRSATLLDVLRRAVRAGWSVVVDAPPLTDSELALDCLQVPGSAAALVVGRGRSRPSEVLSAAELLEGSGDFVGAVLNELPAVPWRRQDTEPRRRSRTDEGGSYPEAAADHVADLHEYVGQGEDVEPAEAADRSNADGAATVAADGMQPSDTSQIVDAPDDDDLWSDEVWHRDGARVDSRR